jgi:hypothetical protein
MGVNYEWEHHGGRDVLPSRFGVFLEPFVLEGFFGGKSAIRVVRK